MPQFSKSQSIGLLPLHLRGQRESMLPNALVLWVPPCCILQWHRVINAPLLSPWPFLDDNKRLHISLKGPSAHGQVVQLYVGQLYLFSDVSTSLFLFFFFYDSADSLGFPSEADTFSHAKVTHGEEKPIRSSDPSCRMENNWPAIASQFIVAVFICGHYILLRIFIGGKRGEAYSVEYVPTHPTPPPFHMFCLRNWIRCESSTWLTHLRAVKPLLDS